MEQDDAPMVYDAATGNAVLWSEGNQTWTWTGTSWTQEQPATSPFLSASAMVYDAATGNVILFGGANTTGTPTNQTWVWNGTDWTREHPATSPPARTYPSMAYDAATGNVVLFGGSGIGRRLHDTWTWSGSDWVKQAPATSPSKRWRAAMTYDPATGNVVLFGGQAGSGQSPKVHSLGDTWTWNGSTWTKRTPATSPPARQLASLTFDAATHNVLLFGGASHQLGTELGDTWTWNGHTWAQRSPGASPSARSGASMTYDAATGNVVLFAGQSKSGPQNDTWTWNGHTWTRLTPREASPAREPANSGAVSAAPPSGQVFIFDS